MKIFPLILLAIALIVVFSCGKEKITEPEPEPDLGNPYHLEIERIADNAVELSWEIPELIDNTFVISRKNGENSWDNSFRELEAGTVSFIDTIYTQAFIVYSYYLSEVNNSIEIGVSDTVAFFSDSSLPTEITLEHIKQDSIKISWHDNAYGEFFYGIDKKTSNNEWIENYISFEPEPANGHDSDMSIVDYDNCLSDSVHYRIYLVNGISKSNQSNSSIYSSLLPPSEFKAKIEGDGIKLTWLDNYQTETGFSVERKVYGGEFEEIHVTGSNAQSFSDDDLEPTEIYFYRIKVMVNDLHSDFSDTVVGCVQHDGYWVPLDYPTIQDAVDATNSVSQIVILPGVYFENVLVQDKFPQLISLFSILGDEDFIEQTVIDGSMEGSAIAFVNCDLDDLSITGVTLQNGSGRYADTGVGSYYFAGGGILCENADVTISNVIIKDNISDKGGGIAFINYSDCEVTNTIILNNSTVTSRGGGIYCYNSVININNTSITNNSTSDWGGGIYIYNSTADITNSSICDNYASDHGGGVYIDLNFNILIENSIISRNHAGRTGGGIRSSRNDPVFKNLIISENSANDGGGIAFGSTQYPIFENVLVINNTANYGAGIYTSSVDVNITNVTVCNNVAVFGGGALYSRHYADPVITNCIFWSNLPEEIMIRPGNQPSYEGTVTISFSNIQGGLPGVSALNPADIFWLEGNSDDDPFFTEDFHLQINSPCIDAGNPDPEYNDPDGSRNDMGAYGGPNGDW
jgi:predicted outer membrane repeat protein